MRISDWSSDVCSSDLTDANDHNQRNVFKDAVIQSRKAHFTGGDDDKNLIHLDTPLPFDIRDVLAHANFRNTEMVDSGEVYADRKSVVSGKRVSVRVDLGGRRSIKKTKSRKNYNEKKNKST